MRLPIYLDYAATTPVDPRVAKVMGDCLTADGNFGNPASRSHMYGWRAEETIENARADVAQLINADPREIVWTSGATESNNLALKGVIDYLEKQGRLAENCHLVTSVIEHKALLDSCGALASRGVKVHYLEPNKRGEITLDQLRSAVTDETVLVSLMGVNNELGTINPTAAFGRFCRERGILFHVDGAQAVGKVDIDVVQQNIDLLSISAHKMYGPKGVGALYVRRTDQFQIEAQIHGGGHERGMRSGTLPTHQIAGLGCAAQIAFNEMAEEQSKITELGQCFRNGVVDLPGVQINGASEQSVPGIINLQFAGIDGETLMMTLRELAVSSGSACTSASVDPSYVLKAIGLSDALALSSLRFSFGRFTQLNDIENAVAQIRSAVEALRHTPVTV